MGGTGDATTSYGTCDGDWYVWSVNWGTPPYTAGPMNRSLFGPNYARNRDDHRRHEQHADRLGGLHRSCPDAELREHAGGPFGPHHRDHSFTNIPLPGADFGRGAGLSVIQLRHRHRESESRRPDRSHPLGQRRRLLFGFHHGHAAESDGLGRRAGPPVRPTPAGPSRWIGTGSTRTTAARPTCRFRPAAIIPAGSMPSSPTAAFTGSRIRLIP